MKLSLSALVFAVCLSTSAPPLSAQSGAAPSAGDRSGMSGDRQDAKAANRAAKLPEFIRALQAGNAKEAKRIFVANGGRPETVVAVPQPGADITLGHVLSDPMPVDNINNTLGVCYAYGWIPWGWNIQTQSFTTVVWGCTSWGGSYSTQ